MLRSRRLRAPVSTSRLSRSRATVPRLRMFAGASEGTGRTEERWKKKWRPSLQSPRKKTESGRARKQRERVLYVTREAGRPAPTGDGDDGDCYYDGDDGGGVGARVWMSCALSRHHHRHRYHRCSRTSDPVHRRAVWAGSWPPRTSGPAATAAAAPGDRAGGASSRRYRGSRAARPGLAISGPPRKI